MSNSVKWVICGVCAVLGIIALIYAVIYVAVPIHALPGFVPGKMDVNGHYHKRALLTAVIGVVLLAIAVMVAIAARRTTPSGLGSSPSGLGSSPETSPAPAPDRAATEEAGGEGGAVPS